MPAEAKRFSRVDKSWIRSQKQSFEMKSVIQCCLGSSVQENTKRILLKDIQKELEICFKSLNAFLDKKRRAFPRYYFLSNSALLTLLSQNVTASNLSLIRPYLSSLFSAIADLKLEEAKDLKSTSSVSLLERSHSPTYFKNMHPLPQREKTILADWEISEVHSADGEILTLLKRIGLDKGTETWVPRLKDSIAESLKRFLINSLADISSNGGSIEELAIKYPTQICLVGCVCFWTKEAELSILDIKNERKAISIASKKFSQHSARLLNLLTKTKWPNTEKPILPIHRIRIEAMITVI